MNKRKVKLLAIAPSESIQGLLYDITASMAHVEMDVYVANHYQAVEIVQQSLSLNYDAILSRGETAAMIKKITQIPVIEFPISFYDVLQAMKLADNFNEPYAIVGFTPVTNNVHMLRDLMQLDLDIFTLFTLDDVVPTMERVKAKGYKLIVSGMGIESAARRNGINSILITTGRDSLASAVDQAVRLCTSLVQSKEQENFLLSLLEHSDRDVMVFNNEKELVFSSLTSTKRELALSLTSRRLQNPQRSDSVSQKNVGNLTITLQEKNIVIGDAPYTLFLFSQQKKAYSALKNEIQVFSREEAADIFLSHYLEISDGAYTSDQTIDKIIHSPLPVMIFGESGVGKRQIAATLYTQGGFQNHPYIIVDFEFATEKTWTYLLGHINSPINSEEVTIYFRGLELLSPVKTEKLKTVLYDSGICKRSKVIFSCTTTPGQKAAPHITRLMNLLSCLSLYMIPLRERKAELKALASLYISTANLELSKQVAGFTPKAMSLLESYQWPGNLSQFNRVITQLVNGTASPYIQEESARRALSAEELNPAATSLSDVLNLSKPLDEIEKDIVKAVLSQTGGNQSQAAARLGICRTTLWRIINK